MTVKEPKVTTEKTIEKYRQEVADNPRWNWGEWDDHIVEMCNELNELGMTATNIYRKGRVQVRYPIVADGSRATRRSVLMALAMTIGNKVVEITFNSRYMFIYFDMGKPLKRGIYR